MKVVVASKVMVGSGRSVFVGEGVQVGGRVLRGMGVALGGVVGVASSARAAATCVSADCESASGLSVGRRSL